MNNWGTLLTCFYSSINLQFTLREELSVLMEWKRLVTFLMFRSFGTDNEAYFPLEGIRREFTGEFRTHISNKYFGECPWLVIDDDAFRIKLWILQHYLTMLPYQGLINKRKKIEYFKLSCNLQFCLWNNFGFKQVVWITKCLMGKGGVEGQTFLCICQSYLGLYSSIIISDSLSN